MKLLLPCYSGSTSAPFAEKKNAKDAAPENSNRDLNELRRDTKGLATRPIIITARLLSSEPWSSISYQVYSEEGADNVI
jgi:hypothetical protein